MAEYLRTTDTAVQVNKDVDTAAPRPDTSLRLA